MAATNRIIAQLIIPYVTYPGDGTQYDELLRAADLMMYRDKACGATVEYTPRV